MSISQGAFVYKSRTKRGDDASGIFIRKLSKRLYLSFCVHGAVVPNLSGNLFADILEKEKKKMLLNIFIAEGIKYF